MLKKRLPLLLVILVLIPSLCACGALKDRVKDKIEEGIKDKVNDVIEEIKDNVIGSDFEGLSGWQFDLNSSYSGENDASEYAYFIDDAGLLDSRDAESLENLLKSFSASEGVFISIRTSGVPSLDARAAAESTASALLAKYDCLGAVVLYVNTSNKEYSVQTAGGATLDDDAKGRLDDAFRPLFTAGKYYQAFCTFATKTSELLGEGKG